MKKPKNPQLSWKGFFLLLALALAFGGIYRFEDLGTRPMHTDEAILAMKTTDFMRTGVFTYDPKDYHGPALHYLTRWIASLRGWKADTLTEAQLRWVPAMCGMLLILGVWLVSDALGRGGAISAALITAASPMMVYYNRYYIMESLFVLLLFLFIAFLWRWTQSGRTWWLLLAGVCLGLLHATKETFVLNVAALLIGWALVKVSGLKFAPKRVSSWYTPSRLGIPVQAAVVVVLIVAALVSVAFYSSFFKDWNGVKDSVLTYGNYLHRSAGSGHEKPWYYYLTLLFWRKDGFVWTEAMIGGLAAVGILAGPAFSRQAPQRAFALLLAGYAVASFIIYSVIPYKTPWTILATHHALTLLAGLGFALLVRAFENVFLRTIWVALFILGLWHLGVERRRAVVIYPTDSRNPYAYAHTLTKAVDLADTLHELSRRHPLGKQMPITIIDVDQGWPLPWYLRDMPHVGYYASVPPQLSGPVIVVDTAMEDAARAKLGAANYVSSPYALRPGILLTLLVEKSLWDKFIAKRDPNAPRPPAATAPPPPEGAEKKGAEAPSPTEPQPAPPSATPAPAPLIPAPAAKPAAPPSIPPPSRSVTQTPSKPVPTATPDLPAPVIPTLPPPPKPPPPANRPPVPGVPRAQVIVDDPAPPPPPAPAAPAKDPARPGQ